MSDQPRQAEGRSCTGLSGSEEGRVGQDGSAEGGRADGGQAEVPGETGSNQPRMPPMVVNDEPPDAPSASNTKTTATTANSVASAAVVRRAATSMSVVKMAPGDQVPAGGDAVVLCWDAV